MMIDLIKTLLELAIPDAEVLGEGGSGKYTGRVERGRFEGMRPVAKQQLVYGPLNSHIATGEIHAVTMRTLTKEEWRKIKLFS